MSDYLTELRRDLVDAHGRYGRRGSLGRAGRLARPRAWRPRAVLVPVAVAACVAAVLLGAGALRDPQPTAAFRVVAIVQLGGQPIDATLAGGSLWIADYSRRVIRVDPARRAVLQRVPVDRPVSSIVGSPAGVWVATEAEAGDRSGGRLVRLDPRTGVISARVPLGATSAVLAAGKNGVWALDTTSEPRPPRMRLIDPARGATLASTTLGSPGISIAVAPDAVWTLDRHGEVDELDSRTGRAVHHVPGVVDVSAIGPDNALAVDSRGAWVINAGEATVVRIEAGRVVRRIGIPEPALPVLARIGGALWVASGDATRGGYHLARIDTKTAKTAATVALGTHRPNTLVPSRAGLWVIADDGTALLVRADQP